MLTLFRTYLPDRTEGELMLPDGRVIRTLERPDLNNEPFVSCIPEGIYVIQRDHTGKHQWFSVLDVEGRTFIEIHEAHRVSELEGCIAPCLALSDGRAYRSREALELLLEFFGEDSWVLEIKEK